MVKNTLILKETELTKLIKATAENIIKEQELDSDGYPILMEPGGGSTPSIKYQIDYHNKNAKWANKDIWEFGKYWFVKCAPITQITNSHEEQMFCTGKMGRESLNFFNSNRRSIAAIFTDLNREINYWLVEYMEAMPYTSKENTAKLNRVVLEADLDDTNLSMDLAAINGFTLRDIANIWGAGKEKKERPDGSYKYYEKSGLYKLNLSEGRLWTNAPNNEFKDYHYRIIRHICNKMFSGEKLTKNEFKILSGKDGFLSNGRYKERIIKCMEDRMPELGADGEDGWFDYHIVLAGIEILFYIVGLVGAAFSWTGFGVPVAAIGMWASLVVGLVDSLSYVYIDDEPDYFLAGLSACFLVMPAAKLGLKPISKITGIISKNVGKVTGNVSIKALSSSFKTLTRTQKMFLKNFFDSHPLIVTGAKAAVKTIDEAIKAHKLAIKSLRELYGFGFLIRQIEWVIKNVFKMAKFCCKLILSLATIVTAYDPATTSGVIRFLGTKFEMDGFNGVADFLQNLADNNIGGFYLYKKLLSATGSIKGVITTTHMDCNGYYEWLKVREAFKLESPTEWSEDEDDDVSVEDALWKAWQAGWRPGYDEYFIGTKITSENKEQLSLELALRLWDELAQIKSYRNEFIVDEWYGPEQWEDIEPLLDCNTFLKEYFNEDGQGVSPFQTTLATIMEFLKEKGVNIYD